MDLLIKMQYSPYRAVIHVQSSSLFTVGRQGLGSTVCLSQLIFSGVRADHGQPVYFGVNIEPLALKLLAHSMIVL